jgi:site-specific DNA-methyltransferase (adenine-specific)
MRIVATEQVPLSKLKTFPGNPRRGDVEAIRASLRTNGQFRAVVVRNKTKHVLAGNHTFMAAKAEGWESMLCHLVSCTEEEAKRIVLADNRLADQAVYDDEALAALLASLEGGLEGTGYDDGFLQDLLADLGDNSGEDPNAVPDPPAVAVTRPGDLYELGRHRLLCGDATDPAVLERLAGGQLADVMWTDPPYGVEYVGKTKDALTIQNDGAGGIEALLEASFAACSEVLKPGAAIYVAHPPGALAVTFGVCFLAAGWRLHETLVWVKDRMVLGRSDYHYRHEPILFGETEAEEPREHEPIFYGYNQGGEGRRGRGGQGWFGGNKQHTVLEYSRPSASREHPTMKPVELIERCLANSARAGMVVLDPFAGSGSTLIAAENRRLSCWAVELDPVYCDVIVARWEKYSGKSARKP